MKLKLPPWRPSLHGLKATIYSILERVEKPPRRTLIYALVGAFLTLYCFPLFVDLTVNSEFYKAFRASNPLDRALGWTVGLATQTVKIPVLVLLILGSLVWVFRRRIWNNSSSTAFDSEEKRELEGKLAAAHQQIETLKNSEQSSPKPPKDVLSSEERRIITCTLCMGEVTAQDLVSQAGIHTGTINQIIQGLRYDPEHQFLRAFGTTQSGEQLYCLTDSGKSYAAKNGFVAIEQSTKKIKQTAAEAEIARLNQALEKMSFDLGQAVNENKRLTNLLPPRITITGMPGGGGR